MKNDKGNQMIEKKEKFTYIVAMNGQNQSTILSYQCARNLLWLMVSISLIPNVSLISSPVQCM